MLYRYIQGVHQGLFYCATVAHLCSSNKLISLFLAHIQLFFSEFCCFQLIEHELHRTPSPPRGPIQPHIFLNPHTSGNRIPGVINPDRLHFRVRGPFYDVISVFFRLNFKVLFIAAFWAFFAGFGD